MRTTLGNTAIVINDTAEHVKTLVDITPAMADQVQELFRNVPGLLGRIREDLKVRCIALSPVAQQLAFPNFSTEDCRVIASFCKRIAFAARNTSSATTPLGASDTRQKSHEHSTAVMGLYFSYWTCACTMYTTSPR